jgi:ubiquitin-conjugating enzyme E2 J2
MVEKQAIMRLNKEFTLLQHSRPDQIRACPSERDTLTWYYIVHNLPENSPYYGGQYFGKLVFPREYPLKPPSIYMITPSGRFEVNTRLCLSMSDYHPESWNPSWRVETILLGLISFMTDETEPLTTGGISSSFQSRRNDALLSFFRNMRHKEFRANFPDLTDPSKYAIGVGFCDDMMRDKDYVLLSDLKLTADDLSDVQTIEELRSVLRHHGVSETLLGMERSDFNQSVTAMKGDSLAWLAIVALVGAWVYTQIKS